MACPGSRDACRAPRNEAEDAHLRSRSVAHAVFRARRLSGRRADLHRGCRLAGSGIRAGAGSTTRSRSRSRQGLDAAPHGVEPKGFPVFSKPITNLKGMGVGSRVLRSAADYVTHYAPGHMWMTLLDRPARLVRRRGARRASRCGGATRPASRASKARSTTGRFTPSTTARSSGIAARGSRSTSPATPACSISRPSAGASSRRICASPTSGRTSTARAGSRRWCGSTSTSAGTIPTRDRRDGYSVVLFCPHGPRYRHPPQALVDEVRAMPSVSSVQITFHEDKPPDSARDAAGRVSARHCELLRSCGRQGGARQAARVLRGEFINAHQPRPHPDHACRQPAAQRDDHRAADQARGGRGRSIRRKCRTSSTARSPRW